MKRAFDIIVVGAGPAGSCAAKELAASGLSVAIVEKNISPGTKPCAGGLVLRGLKHLSGPVLTSVQRQCYKTQVNIFPRGLCFETKKPDPIIAMVMRKDFDRLLLREASSAGALLITGHKVRDIRAEGGRIVVITDADTLTGDFLIGADGALSVVARKTGLCGQVNLVPAVECELEVSDELFAHFSDRARFDLGFVPQGYGWVFPKKSHLSVGVGRLRKGRFNLAKYLDSYMSFLGLGKSRVLDKRASVISLWAGKEKFAKGHILLTGDAAGLADPLTAEGISNAMVSGRLAAKAIMETQTGRISDVAGHYQFLLARNILKDIRLASKVAHWIYDHPRFMQTIFTVYGERVCEAMMEIMSGQASYLSILANPTTYLRPFRLGGRLTRRSKIDKRGPFG